MPTGYTDKIKDGITFKEYATKCAHAFLPDCRDQGVDEVTLNEKTPSDHYLNELTKENIKLKEFLNLDEEEKNKLYQTERSKRKTDILCSISEKNDLKKKYENMLKQSKKFVPPTKDHREFKKFIISQIEDSLKWDCVGNWHEKSLASLESETFETWKRDKIDMLERNCDFSKTRYEEEIERTQQRNKWVAELVDAIDAVQEDDE